MEDAIFVLAAHVFLKTSDYLLCLDALARLFGPARLQYLLLFLAFVRAAHYWTETHTEIAFEDDINKLLATTEDWRSASSMTRRLGTASVNRSWMSCQPYAARQIKQLACSPQ
jgi:hypothetical protein